jgi:lysophospholipase L1-like esterase
VAVPVPRTSRAVVLQRVLDRLALRTQRGVCVFMQTDSINDQGSDDARFGSWHGALQALFEREYSVASVKTVIGKMPLPNSLIPARKWLGFENFLADYSFAPPDPQLMEPYRTTGVPSGAGVWGLGRQASFQPAGSGRAREEYATGFHALIRNTQTTNKYNLFIDNETTPRIRFTGGPVMWRKHMVTGLDGGKHAFRVEFVEGGNVILGDMAVYRGTETRGIRVYNAGRAGISLNALSTVGPASDPEGRWAQALPLLADDGVSGPDIVINSIGTNNMGDDAEVFKDMLRSNTALIRRHAPNSIIFFMLPQEPYTASAGDWPGKIRVSHEIAAEFENVIVTPLSTLAIPQGIPRMSVGTQRGLMLDVLHPRTPLYTGVGKDAAGKDLTYGYAPTSFNYITGAIESGAAPTPPVIEEPTPGAEALPATPTGFGGFSFNGDSLAEQFSAWATRLKAAYPSFNFVNRAKGGWLSAEAAAFQGGEPAMVTFPDGIPASGTTSITVSPNLLAIPNPTTGSWSTTGYVAGVNGTINMTRTNGVYSFTFTRTTAGAAVAVSAAVPFLTGFGFRNRVMITSLGRNDAFITTPTAMSNRWRNMRAWSTVDPAMHVLLEIPYADKVTEGPGTANRAKIDAINNRLAADFPENFLRVATFLRNADALRAAGITPTAADLQDIEDGFIPESFRITLTDDSKDTLHYNEVAYTTFTPKITEQLTARGLTSAETGAPAPDTTPPTVTVVSPADGYVVPDGGTVDFIVQASDASGIGARAFMTPTGMIIGPGAPVALGGGQYGHLGVTAAQIRALDSTRWFASFKDASPAANVRVTSARTITAADATAPVDTTAPVISNVTPATGAVFGDTVTITASVTHALGVDLVIVYREMSGKEPEYVGALVKGTGDVWSGAFPSTAFLGFSGFTVLAKAANGKTAGTTANTYTFAAPADVTAPTGLMLSPTDGLTLGDELKLRATAEDAGTGVARVDFYSDGFRFASDATLRTGTTANGLWGADVPLDTLITAGGPTTGTREIHARYMDAAGNFSNSPSIFVGLPEPTDPGSEVFPSFDANTFLPTRPEVLAAWMAAFSGGGGSITVRQTRPDGNSELVIGV